MTVEKEKIAIVTGANGGVGFGICQRFLEVADETSKLIMACRNYERANKAKELLLDQFPFANIEIELVDVGSVKSVLDFCSNISKKYTHINYIFCNAGILSTSGINWKKTFYMFLFDTIALMERSDATNQIVGEINQDGLGKVFATNVLGHYIMMRELEPLLENSGEGRVIWTSSITARDSSFDINDWQGIKSEEPYESSKWACDLISVASSERFSKEKKSISSFTTSPGVVASEIGDLAKWILISRIFLHYIMRLLGVASQNITPYNGAIADIFAAFESLEVLNYLYRYNSLTSPLGKNYVEGAPIENYNPVVAEQLVEKCELTYQSFKKTYAANAKPSDE